MKLSNLINQKFIDISNTSTSSTNIEELCKAPITKTPISEFYQYAIKNKLSFGFQIIHPDTNLVKGYLLLPSGKMIKLEYSYGKYLISKSKSFNYDEVETYLKDDKIIFYVDLLTAHRIYSRRFKCVRLDSDYAQKETFPKVDDIYEYYNNIGDVKNLLTEHIYFGISALHINYASNKKIIPTPISKSRLIKSDIELQPFVDYNREMYLALRKYFII